MPQNILPEVGVLTDVHYLVFYLQRQRRSTIDDNCFCWDRPEVF